MAGEQSVWLCGKCNHSMRYALRSLNLLKCVNDNCSEAEVIVYRLLPLLTRTMDN